MLKTGLSAVALLFATGAQAQKADEFRLIGSSDDVVVLASTLVTGPKTERRMTEILVRRERSDTGADSYVIEAIMDCVAGTLAVGDVKVYQADQVINRIPRGAANVSKPEEGSVASQVYQYGCTGVSDLPDDARPVGVLAAIAYGRKYQGLED